MKLNWFLWTLAYLRWSVDGFVGEAAHEDGEEAAEEAGHAVEVVHPAGVVEVQQVLQPRLK